MKTITTWKGGEQYDSSYRNGKLELDGGDGFSPKALLLSGLAGCSGIDVVSLLQKMRVPFSGLEIEAATTQTDEHPRVFRDIHLIFKVRTAEEHRPKVQKAIELSLEKYCGVAAMLRKNSSILYTIDIQPES